MTHVSHRATVWLLLTAIVLLVSEPLHASDELVVRWDNLATSVEPYDDPFLDMKHKTKSDLRDVLLMQEAQSQGRNGPELEARGAAARERLVATGFDPDTLLEQRLVVMERRREEARGVTSTFLDREVILDGYVLPLQWEDGRAVEFLLVPWVGACIHTPPPAANQIVHVSFPKGIELGRRFQPFRLSGTLRHHAGMHTLFLIDGSRHIPVSYRFEDARIAGVPGDIAAASKSSVPVITRAQIWVNGFFTSGMTAIEDGGSIRVILLAVLFAFAYGVLHTLGPGHGKAVIVSYFVGTGGNLRRGLTMGVKIAVFHVLSAIAVVGFLDVVVRQTTGAPPSDTRLIRLGSYALINAIGAVMLWQAIRAWRSNRSAHASSAYGGTHQEHAHHHHSVGHAGCAACAAPKGGSWVALAIGAVPCTGALLVMLFGMANDLIVPAVLMVIAISAGMAVAMSAIGMSALWAREWAETRWAPNARMRARFEIGARLSGAICVRTIGSSLFAFTLTHASMDRVGTIKVALQGSVDDVSGN